VLGDRERPARIRSEQDRELARYLQRQVRAYSNHYRTVLQRAQPERAIRKRADLARLPLTSFDEVGDGRDLVLRPDYDTISRYGGLELGARLLWARIWGRVEQLGRTVVDPAYKPVLWLVEDGVPIGSSAADLERLSELGRRWLETAGVVSSDVVVGILPPGPYLPFWELSLGARRGGLSSVFLEPTSSSTAVARLQPTVLVGQPNDLVRLLEDAHASGNAARL
jgi:phenylacetate-coenzyme A ligase PaaK-like adenylate-forming protein